MARNRRETNRPIESYEHRDKERLNNPPAGLVTPETDPDAGQQKKTYAYDPHLDPQLVWAGKAEHTSFEVPTVSLHVHERIDPKTIIEAVRKKNGNGQPLQLGLFEEERKEPLRNAIEFYQHKHGWSNRLIAGDSLLVMNSLLEKEGMAGKVQMIYIDPPYGIKYGSNFQPFVNRRDVKDGKDEDLTAEPEQIRAFRDTWELGIHSYLTYLRDRLLLARELLTESGSIFVQISDENVHRVRCLMDEVFGAGNFVAQISFVKTTGFSGRILSSISDYLLWYARDVDRIKFRQLYRPKEAGDEGATAYKALLELGLRAPSDSDANRLATSADLTSQGESAAEDQEFSFNGRTFRPPAGLHWKTTVPGLTRLATAGRIFLVGNTLRYLRFLDDFPVYPIANNWTDTGIAGFTANKVYVVQTLPKVIERCLLMTTDPGDLVFDPTCVRKGTRVWRVESQGEGHLAPSPALPVDGEGENVPPPFTGEVRRGATPFTGEVRRGETTPPTTRQPLPTASLLPIEAIQPGDCVLGHDGRPHRVLRVIRKPYCGQMVGIRHDRADRTLWLTADHRVLCKPRPRTLGGERNWSGAPIEHLERRRQLRKDSSPPERALWSALRRGNVGYAFRRQHPIGPYIADFYSREAHLVVEVDGTTHYEPEAVEYDRQRDAYMRALGLDVPRFSAREIATNLEGVCLAIRNQCDIRAQSMEGAVWVQAGALQPGDSVFFGHQREAVTLSAVEYAYAEEEVYDLEVEGAHSFITEVCAVHNCGSGTTAYVAEQWGRRWITCDTSRVALALARQRLMTAVFDYYELAHPQEGVGSGFKYKTVPHVTLKSIANNPDIREGMTREQIDAAIARHAPQETLYDQPFVDNKKTRVSGPFTVEAVPAPVVKSVDDLLEGAPQVADASIARSGETLRQGEWRDELLRAGIRGKGGQHIRFARLEPLPGCRWLHADGETKEDKPQRIVVSFGPEHAPLEQRQVAQAIEEAQTLVPKPKLIVFAAFQFDPEAARDIDETNWPGVTLLKAQMNADLLTEDLKKKRASNESFWLIGQPDVRVERIAKGEDKGKYRVQVAGFDYYNTKTGGIESGGEDKIAVWLLDTDYDGRSLYPRQVFFPMAGEKDGWARLAKNLKAEIDEELIEAYRGTVSLPFEPGAHKRIAVKIVDDRGIESLKVMGLPESWTTF